MATYPWPRLRRKGGARDAYVDTSAESERCRSRLPPTTLEPSRHRRLRLLLRRHAHRAGDANRCDAASGADRVEGPARGHSRVGAQLGRRWAPRFLVFSSMPFPRRLATTERPSAALLSDAWDGYPASLERLLDAVVSAGRSNIVCLSGDEHLSSLATAARATKAGKIRLRSIHCSGLYTPYPLRTRSPRTSLRTATISRQ